MKKSRKDPLQALADDILKGRVMPPERKVGPGRLITRQDLDRRASGFVKSMGAGGIVFDFGDWTGNEIADRATILLNQFSDPVQAQTARDQHRSITKSFESYVELGEHGYAHKTGGQAIASVAQHPEWNPQFKKSLDEQVVELVRREGLGAGDGSSVTGPGVSGDFNKSTLKVGNAQVVAQSETDAAVIEMMKSMGADLTDEQGFAPEG